MAEEVLGEILPLDSNPAMFSPTFTQSDALQGGHDLDAAPPELIGSDPNIARNTGQVIREKDSIEGSPVDESAAAPNPSPEPGAKRKAGLQARIDKLVKRTHQSQEENVALKSQLAALNQQLASLQSSLVQSRSSTPSLSGTPDFTAPVGGQPASGDVSGIEAIVNSAVSRALKPLTERMQSTEEQALTRMAHERAFAEAAEEYPELRDNSSDFRQMFNQIYDARVDLQRLEDAPILIAGMVRGLLADQRKDEQSQSAKKRAAVIHTPIPQATEPQVGVPKAVKSALAEAQDRMRLGRATFQDYKLLRHYNSAQVRGQLKR